MGQSRGLRTLPLGDENWFRGTPFGHMALYVESACRDDDKLIRQCREGERGGVVLTVDKQLKDTFFIVVPRNEFFYGALNPGQLPPSIDRVDIQSAFHQFNAKYDSLYKKGPGISGFGQDYGILYIRKAWGIVYPTTREEEEKIIEYWQKHIHDEFYPVANNCVSTLTESLNYAGLGLNPFIRRRASYNAYVCAIKKLLFAGARTRAPDGNYLKRDGSYVTEYEQLKSRAVIPSNRPFNVYTLRNLEYLRWLCPKAPFTSEVGKRGQPTYEMGKGRGLPSDGPISYDSYPTGREAASVNGKVGFLGSRPRWLLSKPDEFIRLWIQSFKGIWYLINPFEGT